MIAILADVHFANHRRMVFGHPERGLNSRAQLVNRVIGQAIEAAWKSGATDLVFLGDTLDSVRAEPQIIAELQGKLRTWTALGRRHRAHLLRGNHETHSTAAGDHSLGPLEAVPGVYVYEEPAWVPGPEGASVYMVPWQPGRATEWFPAVLDEVIKQSEDDPPGAHRILCLHLGIWDGGFPSWARASEGAVNVDWLAELARAHGITQVFAGDWHTRRTWVRDAVTIMQVGALCPTGWDNPGLEGYGTLAFSSPSGVTFGVIPGPRFIEFGLGDGPQVIRNSPSDETFVRIRCRAADLALAREALDAIGPGEVVAEPEVAARAKAATSVGTIVDALAEASSDPLVVERCRRYLGCA